MKRQLQLHLILSYCSIEDHFLTGDDHLKVPFISEKPSSEVSDLESDNTLFTLEVQVDNDELFLNRVYQIFDSWDPYY